MTPVTYGSDVTIAVIAPAATRPATPPPTRYDTAVTFLNPTGTFRPCTPSPKVTIPVSGSTVYTGSSADRPARLGTSNQVLLSSAAVPKMSVPASSSTCRVKAPGSTGVRLSCSRVRPSGGPPCTGSSASFRIVWTASAGTMFSRTSVSTGGGANSPYVSVARSQRRSAAGARPATAGCHRPGSSSSTTPFWVSEAVPSRITSTSRNVSPSSSSQRSSGCVPGEPSAGPPAAAGVGTGCICATSPRDSLG